VNNRTKNGLTEAEHDIMKCLWSESRSMSAGEIATNLSHKYSWKVPTAHVLMTRLTDKGFVSVDKKSYPHKFTAIVSEEEYVMSESAAVIRKTGGHLPQMIASLIETGAITDEEFWEISEIIEKKAVEFKKKKNNL